MFPNQAKATYRKVPICLGKIYRNIVVKKAIGTES